MNKIENKKPLVSIVVVTYNSSQYVLETLESAKAQTYQNIELIVTDDCSKDNTVEICRDWVEENKERFVRTELITVEKNTGISPNCNRGFKAAKGEWVKPIAGDDILNPQCISTFIDYTKKYPALSFLFSDMEIFGNDKTAYKKSHARSWTDRSLRSYESTMTAENQLKKLMMSNNVSSASAIYKRETFNLVGGFDEDIKLLEDYPFWINASKKGYLIISIKEKLIRYRLNESSVQTSTRYKIALELFLQKYIFKNVFFKLIINYINQLKVDNKEKYLCLFLKITAFPQRIIWKTRRKFAMFE
jgi:glycosyltransferase involved in cell wall biosynthesis